MGADGDAVIDGGGLKVVEAGARLKVQTAVFRVGNQ
jgi:hypothetical protein